MIRRAALAAVLLLAAGASVIAIRSFRFELQGFHPTRQPVVRPTQGPLVNAQDFTLSVGGAAIHGWQVPARGRGTIILMHGSGADRSQMAPMAGLLSVHGYRVILYDSPGHGESGGTALWEGPEREALAAVVQKARAEGSPGAPLGIFAFSVSTSIATYVAAHDPAIGALVLVGAYADPIAVIRHQYGRYGALSWGPALLADRWMGTHPEQDEQGDLIGRVAPRPVFIIGGAADRVIPFQQAQILAGRAGATAELALLPGAGHPDLADRGPSLYGPAVLSFFDRSLPPITQSAVSSPR